MKAIFCMLLLGIVCPVIATAHKLTYNGGPLVANADVVMVDWNSSVPDDVQSMLPGFYGDILRSDYWTVLLEYASLSQTIDFGTFDHAVTLVPSKCSGSNNCTVDDTDIQAELGAQIDAGHLPAPATDGAGHANTVYMMHFPPNVAITLQGSTSCVQFCGYNNSFSHNSKLVVFGVVPDQSAGCFNGCGGPTSTHIDKETVQASAELTNAVTDAGAGVGQLGWYDNTNGGGQISDICNGNVATVTVDGVSHYAAQLWSNSQNKCTTTSSRVVVTATAGAFGTIDPSGPQAIVSGQQAIFTISPRQAIRQASTAPAAGR